MLHAVHWLMEQRAYRVLLALGAFAGITAGAHVLPETRHGAHALGARAWAFGGFCVGALLTDNHRAWRAARRIVLRAYHKAPRDERAGL